MADDLGVQFFETAKGQYESAGKWRLVLLAAIAYLHVALVMPFAEQTSEKSDVDRDIAGFRAAESALKPVLEATAKTANHLEKEAGVRAADLRKDLVDRFATLSALVNDPGAADGALSPPTDLDLQNEAMMQQPQTASHASQVGLQAHQTETDPGLTSPEGQGLSVSGGAPSLQGVPVPGPSYSLLAPLPSGIRMQIADGSAFPSSGEVSPDFAKYIESAIIAPAFENANAIWRASVLPNLNERADGLANQIENAKVQAPSAGEQLDALASTIFELRAEAEKLTFAPPSDPTWWWTVGGKETSIQSMMEGFKQQVRDVDERHLKLTGLQAKTSEILGQKEKTIERINTTLEDLERQAAALQSQLGEFGGPLKVINFKLSQLAPLMPLIVGFTLAGIAVWTAEGLRQMSLAARLVRSDDQGRVIRTWLLSLAGGSPGKIAALELSFAVVSLGWVLAAGTMVSALPAPFLNPPVIMIGAVAAVVTARLYHWYRAREALGERGHWFLE